MSNASGIDPLTLKFPNLGQMKDEKAMTIVAKFMSSNPEYNTTQSEVFTTTPDKVKIANLNKDLYPQNLPTYESVLGSQQPSVLKQIQQLSGESITR